MYVKKIECSFCSKRSGARHDKEAEDNLKTEIKDLKQTFLKSNMKAKRYKPASRQDITTKGIFKGIFKDMYWFIHSIIRQSFIRYQL